jgi:hypothetical protein
MVQDYKVKRLKDYNHEATMNRDSCSHGAWSRKKGCNRKKAEVIMVSGSWFLVACSWFLVSVSKGLGKKG